MIRKGKSNLVEIKECLKTDSEVLSIASSISHGKYGEVLCEISANEKDYKISVNYIFKNMKAELKVEAIILIVEIKRSDLVF